MKDNGPLHLVLQVREGAVIGTVIVVVIVIPVAAVIVVVASLSRMKKLVSKLETRKHK